MALNLADILRDRDRVAVAPHRILVVDDETDTADTTALVLQLAGHEVAVAYSGPAALALARDFRPGIVICDLALPGMDGLAVARALRQDPVTARSHLLAVSGYGQDGDRQRCLEAGFDLHLTKPVQPDDFLRTLAALPAARGT
jgi:CheY-like chemotaxis protein